MADTSQDSPVHVNGADFTIHFLDKPKSCGCPDEPEISLLSLEIRDNPDYPEIPDAIVTYPHPGVMNITGRVPGITLSADGHDPRCFDITYPRGSNCKRMCGDLPDGARFVKVLGGSVSHGWARFGETEVFNSKNPIRICVRCKNWGSYWAQFSVDIEFA
jgi:hypothetical protein